MKIIILRKCNINYLQVFVVMYFYIMLYVVIECKHFQRFILVMIGTLLVFSSFGSSVKTVKKHLLTVKAFMS